MCNSQGNAKEAKSLKVNDLKVVVVHQRQSNGFSSKFAIEHKVNGGLQFNKTVNVVNGFCFLD